MAGWGSAFAAAFKIVLMSIVWAAIGIVLIAVGLSMAGATLPGGMPGQALPRSVGTGQALLGIVVAVIGYGLLLLGTLASFLKYSAEYYAQELQREMLLGQAVQRGQQYPFQRGYTGA